MMADPAKYGFRDLPPEIRNNIYGLALHVEKAIPLDWTVGTISIVQLCPKVLTGSKYADKQTTCLNVNLLRTNRQVNAEATPVLYGANTFAFGLSHLVGSEQVPLTFLQTIGDSRKCIRHVDLDNIGNAVKMRSALHLLKQAAQLDSFACSHDILNDLCSMTSKFNALLPWLKTLQKAADAAKGRQGPLEVLKLPTKARACFSAEHPRLVAMHAE